MTDLSKLKLFATQPHACSYLENQQSTTIFVDPAAQVDIQLYTQLSEFGFRRSGDHLYRPRCQQCQACIPIRIPIKSFTPSRNHRRCLKKNNDLKVYNTASIDTDECYALYEKYIAQRHNDGDMYPASRKQYQEFLSAQWQATHYLQFRRGDTLLGVAVTDLLQNAVSAVYTFYDPDEEKRSLGRFAVLKQIAWAEELNMDFLYLGYWIKQCKKMSYKIDYRPFQLMINNAWINVCDR
jgi:leucyl-tRNA---protein transferase